MLFHSSRMAMCELTPAQCEYKSGHWRSWYAKSFGFYVISPKLIFSRYIADWVYGHATLYFMCAVVGVFAIPHILTRIWRASKRDNPLKGNKIWQRALASTRFLGYRTFYLRGLNWYSPATGVMLLGLAGLIYFMCTFELSTIPSVKLTPKVALTLGPKPYYWPKKPSYGDSPPIATRSGWMALALLPFVM